MKDYENIAPIGKNFISDGESVINTDHIIYSFPEEYGEQTLLMDGGNNRLTIQCTFEQLERAIQDSINWKE